MKEKQNVHMTLRAEDPDHVRAWEILQNRDRNKYPTLTEYLVDVINNRTKKDSAGEQNTPDMESGFDIQKWTDDLLDEIEKRLRMVLRGPVGR